MQRQQEVELQKEGHEQQQCFAEDGTATSSTAPLTPNATMETTAQPLETAADAVSDANADGTWRSRCRRRPLYGGNREALGWALDAMGRSVSFIGAAVFLGTALINLAKREAGCATEAPPGETTVPDCDARVRGFVRPSSLLTTYSLVVGLTSSALLPILGAFVDHTDHRRLIGRASAALYCVLLFPQVFVGEGTWFAIAIIQFVVAFIGWIHAGVAFAYLPEMSDDVRTLEKFNASFAIVQFGSMVAYIIVIVGIATAFGIADDDVASARLGQSVSFVLTSMSWGYAWTRLFRERPAMEALPVGASYFTIGFKKVYRTSLQLYINHRALMWFYISVSFSESAVQSLAVISITYMTDELEFTTTENGVAVLLMLLFSIPGCFVSAFTTRRFDAIRSDQASLFLLALITACVALFVTGTGQQVRMYILASGWGLGAGWKYTTERFLTCTIIPKGQDAELMGLYLFSGQVLTWLPPLVFTAMNEAGVSMRISIASVNIFLVIGILILFLVGRYNDAVRHAQSSGGTSNEHSIESVHDPGGGGNSVKDDGPLIDSVS